MFSSNSVCELDTPTLLVDLDILETNILNMAAFAADRGTFLRPHVKTHKTPKIALMQMAAGANGITVAKLSEAEVFAKEGIRDIFVAYPVIGQKKLDRAASLSQQIKLLLAVDSIQGAKQMSCAAEEKGITFKVRLEVDLGLKRTGVTSESAIRLAKYISQQPGLHFEGIFAFRGISYPGQTEVDATKVGTDEGNRIVRIANELRDQGIAIQSVSAGSTPTARSVGCVEGITEIRPGTYVFNDMMQVKAGAAAVDNCAASVLVTVVSCPEDGRAIIDGGSKTFAGDIVPDSHPFYLNGYGRVIGHDDVIFATMSEEHGILQFDSHERPPFHVGDKIRIIPNHICTVVNLFNEATVISRGSVIDAWPIAARGHRH